MKKKVLVIGLSLSTELSSCQTLSGKIETPVHEHRNLSIGPDIDQTENLPKPLSPKEYGMNLKHKRKK